MKNNMQIISSLLGLQSVHVKDPRDSELFEISQGRVRSMALVHEKLYQSESLAGLDFQDYITDLAHELSNSYNLTSEMVNISIRAKDMYIDIENAIPCSLIVYELVSNALKHAFHDGRSGEIAIDFYREGDHSILRVSDNGVGMPPGVDYRNTASLGLRLVTALVQQLHADIELDASNGPAFTITMQEKP